MLDLYLGVPQRTAGGAAVHGPGIGETNCGQVGARASVAREVVAWICGADKCDFPEGVQIIRIREDWRGLLDWHEATGELEWNDEEWVRVCPRRRRLVVAIIGNRLSIVVVVD